MSRQSETINWLTLSGVAFLALLAVAYFIIVALLILPRWQTRAALNERLDAAETALNVPLDGAPGQSLDDTTAAFLTDADAAQVLDSLYQIATISGVNILELSAQPVFTEAPKSVVDIRPFRFQATGDTAALLDFLTRFQQTAVSGVMVQNLTLTESGESDLLTFDLLLFTSPYAVAGSIGELPDVPIPAPTPTAEPTAAPDLDLLAKQLDDPWAAEDWGTVIVILNQIGRIDPGYPELQQKLYAAHVNFGYQLLERGGVEQAREQFETAVSIDPTSGEAQLALESLENPTPAPSAQVTHTVQRGDTLFSIARRYDVTVDAIRATNGLVGNTITPGQTLIIP